MYRDKTYGVAIVSATLTAASWAIAAFYWSAWWMFGANVPFAVAATVQAGLSTWTTTENFNEYYKAKDDANNFEKIVNDNDYKELKIVSTSILGIAKNKLSDSAISFSEVLGSLTTYPQLFLKFVNKGLTFLFFKCKNLIKKSFNFFENKLFKTFLKNVNNRITNFLTKISEKKIAMKAVSWASPAGNVISVIDTLLSVCSFFTDIALFNPKELSSW